MSLWFGQSGLAKLATIFAIGFAISLGLCGINFIAATGGAFRGPHGGDVIIIAAYIEVAGMAICSIGLLIVGLVALIKTIISKPPSSSEDQ